jgi:excisionase family DNA binding protein
LYNVTGMGKEAPAEAMLTVKAAAEMLGVSAQTLRRWDRSGKLPARRHPINGYRLYPRQSVLTLKRRILKGSQGATA